MGRKKNNLTVNQDVKSFSETKEESLTVFSKQGLSISQEIVDMFDVKPVGKANKIGGGNIKLFSGKQTYLDALKLAHEWKDEYNKSHKETEIKFIRYYPQEFKSKSILMEYSVNNV